MKEVQVASKSCLTNGSGSKQVLKGSRKLNLKLFPDILADKCNRSAVNLLGAAERGSPICWE